MFFDFRTIFGYFSQKDYFFEEVIEEAREFQNIFSMLKNLKKVVFLTKYKKKNKSIMG